MTPPPPTSLAADLALDTSTVADATHPGDVDFSAFWHSLGVSGDVAGQAVHASGSQGAGGISADPDFEAFFSGFLAAPSVFDNAAAGPPPPDAYEGSFGLGAPATAQADAQFAEAPSFTWDAEQGYAS